MRYERNDTNPDFIGKGIKMFSLCLDCTVIFDILYHNWLNYI